MKKPVFAHCNTIYTLSWILAVPILIDISTACTLVSFWIVWVLFFLVLFLSAIRLWHGFAQKCYKFCWSLIAQLVGIATILLFFQLSFNNVIHTPLSHSVTPDIVEIANPVLVEDSMNNKIEYKSVVHHSQDIDSGNVDNADGDNTKTKRLREIK